MNPLVAIRSNATGLYNPTPAQKQSVAAELVSSLRARQMASLPKAALASLVKAGGTDTLGVRDSQDELGRDAFLQLLMQQVQSQDPMNPVDNSEMVAQLAQFSALEQQQNLNSSFEDLAQNFGQLNFMMAANLIDRTVSWFGADGQLQQGAVQAVSMQDGAPQLQVNGAILRLSDVVGVS